MSYSCHVLADSIARGVRLTTLQVTLPRIVLAEFNTHRVFSRNSASSRAIPVATRIAAVRSSPFVPEAFGKNRPGMQASEQLEGLADAEARHIWETAMRTSCTLATQLAEVGVHKQLANRLIEPFSWTTVVVTSTEWENFFALRISEHAQPEIRRAAEAMKAAVDFSVPDEAVAGTWHLPFITQEDRALAQDGRWSDADMCKVSTARCARVSYLTHDGRRSFGDDIALHDRLLASGHMSPFEHVAKATAFPLHQRHWYLEEPECILCGAYGPDDDGVDCAPLFLGNFRSPWRQYRKTIRGEDVFRLREVS